MKRIIQWLISFAIGLMLCLAQPSLSQSPSSAQTLDNQAQQQLSQGNAEAALQSWTQAEQLYRQFNSPIEALGAQLNQSKALYALGYYRRAQALLEQLQTPLLEQPDSSLKANGLLTLGNILRRVGEFDRSQQHLEQSLAIAEQIHSQRDRQAAYFQLGNTLLEQNKIEPALIRFRQAAEIPGGVQLPALLNQLKLLIQTQQRSPVEQIVLQIRSHLDHQSQNQPITSTTIYARIEFAEHLVKLAQTRSAAEILSIAIKQAKQINDRRAQSYGMGRLAHVYEQSQQWNDAQLVNQTAMMIAEQFNAPDILYQWQWQSGRIRNAIGDRQGSIQDYGRAIKTLQGLRMDLVAVSSDVQFSFREQVEPVYREFVSLLLQQASEPNLIEARDLIESLQLEELNNFFREACLTAVAQPIDQVDQQAAIFYPIILNNRLEVIVSMPGKKLRHYTTVLPRIEIEAGIDRMLQSMRSTSFEPERLAASQELYRWLIQPAADDLARQSIKTLVFILDGSLRSVPMAALHSGKQYLVEDYAIALTPGLQLVSPRSLQGQLNVLVGGLSKSNQGSIPLPGVQEEILQIKNKLKATVLENETFTSTKLQQTLKTNAFSVVHLATHGQFSSTAKDTFIQTWNGRINVDDLRSYLTQRDIPDSAAIELLVLSACETAQGDDRAALGMAGVAIRSGARSTLASLWAVNDASTAAFVTQFYQGLTRNQLTRAEALRQAQLQLLHMPNYHHPYYWAAFTLIGNWL
jgi:CHAT domain-containing protein